MLVGPWGGDAIADRHWLSQDVLLREAPGAPLPAFLGRVERLQQDFGRVARRYVADFALGGYAPDGPDGLPPVVAPRPR